MNAITIVKDEANNHRMMQIELDLLSDDNEQLEDIFAIIAIELHKKRGINSMGASKATIRR